MNARYVLKDSTKSLCPHCYREIPASIIEECNGIYMEKSCPDHGLFRAMVEKDASVYKALMNKSSVPAQVLIIPITHRCDLRCKMCFLPDDGVPSPSRASIFCLIDNFEGNITFSGGEPILRDDLPELIEHAFKQGRDTCIVTNGLRLCEKKLLYKLEDAGLTRCLFSMNGLSDDVFKQIEDRPLLQKKLVALENLRGTSIKVSLSTTLVSGVNTEELPALADFYMTNRDLFVSWRLRTEAAIGKHTGASKLWMSDMLNLVCKTLNIDREKLLKGINPNHTYHGASHLGFNVLSTVGDNRRTLGYRTFAQRSYMSKIVGFENRKLLFDNMSFSQKIVGAFYHVFQPSRLMWYNVHVFAWPDVYNIDLEEAKQTGIYHVGPGGKPMPFRQAIILNDAMPDWNWE